MGRAYPILTESSFITGQSAPADRATGPAAPQYTFTKNASGLDPFLSNDWINPVVLDVWSLPSGHWLKKITDGGGEVITHIRIDTPYPSSQDIYENPCLLYSTDNGDTWIIWPNYNAGSFVLALDYAQPYADVRHLADCFAFLLNDGVTLRCCWFRRSPTPPDTYHLTYVDITGSSLTSSSASSLVKPPLAQRHQVAYGSVVKRNGSYVMFGGTPSVAAASPIKKWISTDGSNWRFKGIAIARNSDGLVTWHCSCSGPYNGFYYMVANQIASGQTGGNTTIYRSTDLDSWEYNTSLLIDRGVSSPAWCNNGLYKPHLYQKTNGDLRVIVGGLQTNWATGVATVDL
jgi:hypothetical protein